MEFECIRPGGKEAHAVAAVNVSAHTLDVDFELDPLINNTCASLRGDIFLRDEDNEIGLVGILYREIIIRRAQIESNSNKGIHLLIFPQLLY